MDKDQVEPQIIAKVEHSLRVMISQAGLLLSESERFLVRNQMIHLYLMGMDDGRKQTSQEVEFALKLWKGGEIKNEGK